MGCDIHCYIEYKQKGNSGWSDFGGRINPGRNYWMFGFMAGVRLDDVPHIEPRGWPKDAALAAFSDNTIYIMENQVEDYKHEDGSSYYSPKHAAECVAKGYCEYVIRNERKSWVTNSDHHTHSWLTADEFELAIAGYLNRCGFAVNVKQLTAPAAMADALLCAEHDEQLTSLRHITEYWPILVAMRCFEAQGCESRLVFWFDN